MKGMNPMNSTKFLVIDTETTNIIDDPFAMWLCSSRSMASWSPSVVADIFLDNELMASPYFAEKIPQYWE